MKRNGLAKFAIALFEVRTAQWIGSILDRILDGSPVILGQQLACARQDLALLGRQVVSIVTR